jgi:hypothetical protein
LFRIGIKDMVTPALKKTLKKMFITLFWAPATVAFTPAAVASGVPVRQGSDMLTLVEGS